MTPERVTIRQAAEQLDVPEHAIWMWRARRKIHPVAMLRGQGRGGGQPLYLLDELRPHAKTYHERVRRRRP